MKTFTRIFGLLLIVLVVAAGHGVQAQSVLNPADTLVTYNPAAPPAIPAYDNLPHKWVRTVRLPWNTTPYKAYIFNGCQFRLCFPRSYNPTANDGKLYPMLVFDHGEGETGTVYDNEYSLYHGGQIFSNAVAAGTFDGYILVMQQQSGWGTSQFAAQKAIIDYMIANNKLDPFRVFGNGLSGGGQGTWQFFTTYPTYNAGIIPMSSDPIQLTAAATVNASKFTPIWNIHGQLDNSPAPYTAAQVLAAFQAAGANYVDLDMLTQGHDTWDSTWSMATFWPWLNSKYCSNPWTLFGQTLFCPGVTPNVTIGLAPGFQAYQWELNGVLQPQWTTNSINVTANGTYSARVERNGNWSLWSPVPVVIGVMPPTVAPPITVAPGFSSAIPDVNGNGTTLTIPANYSTYAWEKSGSNTVIGTSNTLSVTTPGGYDIEVTQLHGCSSSFGPFFQVINANGSNPPDPGSNLIATPLGLTSIVLNWSQNPNPVVPNTGFEVWQQTKAGTPWVLVGVTGQGISLDTIKNLIPGTTYSYEVRALGATAASKVSNMVSATTGADTQAPTAPGNLTISGTTNTSIGLKWTASTDNIGVIGYYIYVNGVKTYSTTGTTFSVDGLVYPQSYDLAVKAFDAAGNLSVASNQVSGEPVQTGITYQTYLLTTPTALPNFNTLPIDTRGTTTSISTFLAPASTNYGILWQGYIKIPTTGTYSFRTVSVDGSEIWLGNLGGIGSPYLTGTAIVANDGLHTSKTVTSSAMSLTAGVYPIAIGYFFGTTANGRASLTVSWQTPSSGTSFVTIPSSAWGDAAVVGAIPVAPTNLAANALAYNQVGLTWADTSTIETGFEVWRSTSATSGFSIVNTVAANSTSFTDGTASPSTTYYYEVRAIGQYGQSAYSAVANATTPALPPAPSVPYNFAAVSTSPTTAKVTWTDSTANVTSYQLYRSNTNDQSYVQIASFPAGTTSYTDASLFSNAVYYYKVTATNVGGVSASPAEIKLTSADNLPVIANIGNLNARYGATTTVNVSASTVNTGGLKLTASATLPSFAAFVDNGNETGTLTFNPNSGNVGNYTGLYIVATDAYGGTDTAYFSVAVNNFYSPVIGTLSNITMNDGDQLTVPLSATDQNSSDTLTISATGLPSGSTVTATGNGTANLLLRPNYAAAGTYTVTVTAHDNNGLNTTGTFVLTVNYKNPNTKIFTRVSNGDPTALGAPWNPLQGTTTNNLLDSAGNTTTVGLSFTPSTWWNTSNDGSPTGNNSGVYPDVVLRDYMWFGAIYGGPNTIGGTVTGLTDTVSSYTLTFFSSSTYNGVPNNGSTTYTVGTQTVSLNVQGNQQNTVSIANIKPQAGGVIPFTLGLSSGTVLGYFNSLVITKQYSDGTPPAGASGLTAAASTGAVLLNWKDSAYNATGYQIWRAPASTGVFSLIGTAAGNSATSYNDSSITSHTQYLYTVDAYNSNGHSGNSDTASVTTLTRLPKITAIANVQMSDTQSVTINVTTTDDPSAQLTLTAANLPPFASFTDNGNGTGVLTLTPSAGTVGVYPNVSVTVADQYDSTATTTFTVAVTEPNVQSVYLSFTGGPVSPAPWNSMTSFPLAGTVMSNLTDGGGNPTTISATLLDGFTAPGSTGWVTGNNDAIYPQSVVQNFYYLYNSSVKTSRIQISGLNNAMQYNFVFFNSQWDGTSGMTYFTINGITDSLQADWNIQKTVQINGIIPVNGVITIGVSKGPAATVAYINSMVIQGYSQAAGTLLNPTGLIATRVTQTTVNLQWQDRSAIATGYQVYRASDASGSYSLIATLPANAVSYQDTKLNKGANYYYVVQAVNGSNVSNYSNVLSVTTYTDAVYIAIDNVNLAPSPWNNLNSPGGQGYTWSNFLDSTGVATSMGMLQTGIFAGANSLGDPTGNNSGVYPDPVLLYQYVLFPGNLGGFNLNGLNLSKVYDITFFNSEVYEPNGNQNTAFIVNGDTVWMNALFNQQATVTMRGVKPDQFGNIYMQFISYQGAIVGWLNAIVVDGYTPVPRNAPAPPSVAGGAPSTAMFASPTALVGQTTVNTDSVASAYPNPFRTSFTLQVPAEFNNENVVVAVYDVKGNLVYKKQFDGLVQGENYLMIEADRNFAGTGTYIARLMYSDGKTVKTVKLLKQ